MGYFGSQRLVMKSRIQVVGLLLAFGMETMFLSLILNLAIAREERRPLGLPLSSKPNDLMLNLNALGIHSGLAKSLL